MANGMYVAAAGGVAYQHQLEVIANNLAQARSVGFKADALSFESKQALGPRGDQPARRGTHTADYVEAKTVRPQLDAGPLTRTDNPLDVALTGNAFLKIDTPSGERLTRNGRLMRGADGMLRTISGDAVLDRAGQKINLPPDKVPKIGGDGQISVDGRRVSHLGMFGLDQGTDVVKDAAGQLIPPETTARLDATAGVKQGFIEESNVKPIQMMLQLVEVQRTFSALRQAITTYGELDRTAARIAR